MPKWYLEEPLLNTGDDFYLKAFYALSTCRYIGNTTGPIQWDRMILYAEKAGLDYYASEGFILIIQAMDAVYLDWKDEQAKKASKFNKRKS